MSKYITVKLTPDQAWQIVRILDYGYADPVTDYSVTPARLRYSVEDKKFNAFLQRIQDKIRKQLATS